MDLAKSNAASLPSDVSREDDDLLYSQKRMEERTCYCGAPRGPQGIIEKVYRSRKTGQLRCKVLMESGAVRYLELLDVYGY